MEVFHIAQTAKTPFIQFDPDSGKFEMKGKSIPENAKVYYGPLYSWLDEYFQKPAALTTLDIQLDYFNTSSAKSIIDLFRKLETLEKDGKGKVQINWHYNEDDGDMQEAGQDYQSMIKIPFNLISFNQ